MAANGVGVMYPPAAPLIELIEKLITTAEEHGILAVEIPAAQLQAIAAGMAAARASAITSDRARKR